jgi:hypothetical protein
MRIHYLIFFTFILSFNYLKAQFSFEYKDSIPVKIGTDTLKMAWVGGLNYAQFSDIDCDFDGDLDLLVFDRSSDNIRVFLQETINGVKQYKLEYNAQSSFPSDIRYRLTTVDYDNDGRKDLFAYGIGGIKVYRNVGDLANGLQWEVAKNLLYSDYWGSYLNLYISSSDIPAIVDVEGDGDIDILTFHISGEHLQYHQNQSMELYGIPDSLEFVLKNECWGGFREDINTSSVFLNDLSSECTSGNVPGAELNPSDIPSDKKPTEQQPKHAGSTVLALDIDNSGVLDLVLGDVSYPNLNLLINGGTAPNTNSVMISNDNAFPSNSLPANLQVFPAAFWVDTDFDSKKDLIVGANAKNISENETSVIQYKNVGTNANPLFVHQTNAFLQNEMIEHGTASIPVFFDYDQDGLEDLFISNFFRYKPVLDKEASIAYYKNTGTSTNPVFTFIDNDFLNLSSSAYGFHMVPTFGDLDNDGDKDLILGLENGTLVYFQNTSIAPSMTFAAPIPNFTDDQGTIISSGQYATPQLFDLNKDGLLDLILGRKTGEIMYFENIGTATSPSFQLKNDTLGNIDLTTTSPDGFPVPHFFRHNDTTILFLGGIDGQLHFYNTIDNNITSGSSFTLFSNNFLGIDVGSYSSFWVNDIDSDGLLNMFVGQDLGGLYHFEVDPNSQASVFEIENAIDLILYPNPTNGEIIIASKNIDMLNASVTDLFGKEIRQKISFAGKTIIDLHDEASGIYLVLVADQHGNKVVKRVVKN